MERVHMTVEEARDLAERALLGAGASQRAAASLARAVAAAEADGIASHGLLYVPTYCEHVACGKVDGRASPTLERPKPSAIRVDAATGFAHPAIDLGFPALADAAREMGAAGLAIFNSYNCGVLGHHVERLAAEGFLAIGFTNAPASIAPVGGVRPVIGTNPFAVAAPASSDEGGAAIVIDQSASVVAKSEIMLRAREREPIPEGWALDPEGRPTTDPAVALKGTMAPAGGHKGFGTGLLVELMAAAMAGATLGKDASPFSGPAGGPPRTGQFFLALEPDTFSGGAFASRLSDLVAAIEGQEGARLPGSRRRANRRRIAEEGIAPTRELIDRIEAFAALSA